MTGLPVEMALVFALTLLAGVVPGVHYLVRYGIGGGSEGS